MDTVIYLGARAIFEEYGLVCPTIVNGSVALMEASIAAGVKRFVYSSSLLVYQSQDDLVDQNTSVTSQLGYGKAKLEAEAGLTRLAKPAGISLASI